MENELLNSLIKFVQPDLDYEELKFSNRWIDGPISVKSEKFVGKEAMVMSVLNSADREDVVELQGLVKKLERGKNLQILTLLYLLRGRKTCETVVSIQTPVVSLNALPPELADPVLERSQVEVFARNTQIEIFSFGETVTEKVLVQDLVYIIQGIEGKYIRFGKVSD